jgi:hypothetical protein
MLLEYLEYIGIKLRNSERHVPQYFERKNKNLGLIVSLLDSKFITLPSIEVREKFGAILFFTILIDSFSKFELASFVLIIFSLSEQLIISRKIKNMNIYFDFFMIH